MSQDLDDRLRSTARELTELPGAPEALRVRLERLPETAVVRARRGLSRGALLIAAAFILVATAVASGLVVSSPRPPITAIESALPTEPPPPTASITTEPTQTLSPAAAGAMTVSEFLAAAERGTLPEGQFSIRGYWTDRSFRHGCAPPMVPPGELQIRCRDGESGITERDEPILTLLPGDRIDPADGPSMTPFVDDQAIVNRLFNLPVSNGQPYPPVPIIARGHVHDPRAADCAPDARKLCRDRFVIDALIEFDPDAVPTPAPTPSPSPFPFDSPPPAKFAAEACAGDVPYEFVGWMARSELRPDFVRPFITVYAAITRDVIAITGWVETPGQSGMLRRLWGRRICYADEWADPGSMSFTQVPGTAYWEYEDGTREPVP